MQLDFLFSPTKEVGRIKDALRIGSQTIPIQFARNRRARHYIIRVQPDGSVRATVPRVGSITEARSFAERNLDWILKQIQERHEILSPPAAWQHGTEILYRGEKVQLMVSPNHEGQLVQFGDQTLHVRHKANVRPTIERHLCKLATRELTVRVLELARQHTLTVKRVIIRNQRSRWGSCSRRGTISLNWRLIQMPDAVRDYVILHELAHTREHNHSQRFWGLVEQVCPNYREAKAWIRQHWGMLR